MIMSENADESVLANAQIAEIRELLTARDTPYPKVGDVVRLAAPWDWAMHRLKIGDLGYIDNVPAGDPNAGRIFFGGGRNPHAGRGPGTIHTPFSELRATEETHPWVQRRYVGSIDRGEFTVTTETVRVWDWYPSND